MVNFNNTDIKSFFGFLSIQILEINRISILILNILLAATVALGITHFALAVKAHFTRAKMSSNIWCEHQTLLLLQQFVTGNCHVHVRVPGVPMSSNFSSNISVGFDR